MVRLLRLQPSPNAACRLSSPGRPTADTHAKKRARADALALCLIDETLDRLRKRGAEFVGEVAKRQGTFRNQMTGGRCCDRIS
jgi:hypothetical protein